MHLFLDLLIDFIDHYKQVGENEFISMTDAEYADFLKAPFPPQAKHLSDKADPSDRCAMPS